MFKDNNRIKSIDHRNQYSSIRNAARTSNIKDKLRESCLQRVKLNRHKYLEASRSGENKENQINQIIVEELNKHKQDFFNEENLSEVEFVDLMQFLEDALYDDLKQEEQNMIETLYEENLKFEKNCLSSATAINYRNVGIQVLCPVCCKNNLMQNHNVVFCSCGVRLQLESDNIDLFYIQKQIMETFQNHNSHCSGQGVCSVQNLDLGIDCTTLLLTCDQCGCFEIIV